MKKLLTVQLYLVLAIFINAKNHIDSTRLDAFMDGLIASKLIDNNIAGATAAVVEDNEILLMKGYGYKDLENRTPVNPDKTLFRIASISKMFTWTAVMQLVENGKICLNRDINEYLEDFKIPDTFEEPVTMTHLMSHTAGFEDVVLGLFAKDWADKPLNELLKNQTPQRVRPPGIRASYSNHGTALSGLIVENVSGMNWNEYVEKNIIQPLVMKNTTFRQPIPDNIEAKISKGYRFAKGEFFEKPFEYVPMSPAGGASTTAKDMTNFMRMFLNKGSFNDNMIIDTATYDKMLQPALYHAPMVNPCRHAFIDISRKGEFIIGHGGDTYWFHSLMALFPERNLGLFISFNSEGGRGSYMDVLDAFVGEFFPKDTELSETIELSDKYLENFTGIYTPNRHPNSDYSKILSLMNQTEITAYGNMLKTNFGNKVKYWLPIDSLLFREKNSCQILAFEKNERGKITHAYEKDRPIVAQRKVPFYERKRVNNFIMYIALFFSFCSMLFWPVVYLSRMNYKPLRHAPKLLPFRSKLIAWVASLVILLFYLILHNRLENVEKFIFEVPGSGMFFISLLPFLLIILTLLMFYNSHIIFGTRKIRVRSKFYYALLVIINIIVIVQMFYWNFVGFKY